MISKIKLINNNYFYEELDKKIKKLKNFFQILTSRHSVIISIFINQEYAEINLFIKISNLARERYLILGTSNLQLFRLKLSEEIYFLL